MTMILCPLFALIAVPLWVTASAGQSSRSVELFLGTAANLPTALTVRQEGEPEIELEARYDTRPLTSPFYYAVRFAFEGPKGAWELQLVHHKLHLSNPPAAIQHFEITHGFNVLTLNRSFDARGVRLRVGAGIVLAHPESTVRGRESAVGGVLDSGYSLTGPALLAGVGKAFEVATDLYVGAEVQLIGARARVPVAGGTATAANVAVHFLFGTGYRF